MPILLLSRRSPRLAARPFHSALYHITSSVPAAGLQAGDRLIVHASGRAMLTRMLSPQLLARAVAAMGTTPSQRPPCTTEGCAVGDCPMCRWADHVEAQLAAARRP